MPAIAALRLRASCPLTIFQLPLRRKRNNNLEAIENPATTSDSRLASLIAGREGAIACTPIFRCWVATTARGAMIF